MKVGRPLRINEHLANVVQSLIPVVMSGIIAVYALVISVLIAGDMGPPPQQNYSLFTYAILPNIVPWESCAKSLIF